MAKLSAKALKARLEAKHGKGSALLLGSSDAAGVTRVAPTGLSPLDRWVLGIGGIPYGRIIEVFGPEGAGKTTIANAILAGVQRDGGIAAYCDFEHKYDPAWAKLLGVNLDELIFMQPPHLESFTEEVETIAISSAGTTPTVVVLDSVAMSKTKSEVEEGLSGDPAIAEGARIWSRSLRHLAPLLHKGNVTLIALNQIRHKIGVMYGNPETTPGGNAIKSAATIRLAISHGKSDDAGGRYMGVMAFKNQVVPPFRRAQLRLNYTKGFNDRWAIINHAKDMGCVDKKCQSLKEALEALHWDNVQVSDEDSSESSGTVIQGTEPNTPESGEAA